MARMNLSQTPFQVNKAEVARSMARLIGNAETVATEQAVGAQRARYALIEIKKMVNEQTKEVGDFDVQAVAALVGVGLSCEGNVREGCLVALADFIASAIDGCMPALEHWNPAERIGS